MDEKRVGKQSSVVKQIKRKIIMKKLMAAISILFIVMLGEPFSASSIIRVDPPPSTAAVVEEESSCGSANSIESEPGGTGSFIIEVIMDLIGAFLDLLSGNKASTDVTSRLMNHTRHT